MDHRILGGSGLSVPLVGLGCNAFNHSAQAAPIFAAALDHGINFFDTADIYGGPGGVSERILGDLAVGHRHGLIIATKCGFATDGSYRRMGASSSYIIAAVEASLRRLRTDYIDLYQIHTPDPDTPLEETLGALDTLVQQGKIRHAGASNYPAWQMVDAHWIARNHGWSGFVSGQNEYSLVSRGIEADIVPAMLRCGQGLLPYFPLASGILSGKYLPGHTAQPGSRFAAGIASKLMTAANLAKVAALRGFAEQRGRTIIDLAFAWLASRPVVCCIIAGASSAAQVAANAQAADKGKMTANA